MLWDTMFILHKSNILHALMLDMGAFLGNCDGDARKIFWKMSNSVTSNGVTFVIPSNLLQEVGKFSTLQFILGLRGNLIVLICKNCILGEPFIANVVKWSYWVKMSKRSYKKIKFLLLTGLWMSITNQFHLGISQPCLLNIDLNWLSCVKHPS